MSSETEELQAGDLESTLEYISVFSNKVRFSIFIYLLIKNELTLEDLSILIKKSKSTIHHHLQKFLELDIIEESIKSGSKTRYYKIKNTNFYDKINRAYSKENFKKHDKESQTKLSKDLITFKTHQITLIQFFNDFLKRNFISYDPNESGSKNLEKQNDIYTAVHFLNEKDSQAFQKELAQLINKFQEKRRKEECEKPWGFYIVGANYKNLLKKNSE